MTAQALDMADEIMAHTLAAGGSARRAAKAAHVSESTVFRRCRAPAFQARVAELQLSSMGEARGRITAETLDACDTLHRLLRSPSEAIQLRAAKMVIELALKLHAHDLRAAAFLPNELAPVEPESLTSPVSQEVAPTEPAAAQPDPVHSPPAVTPPPKAAPQPERTPAKPEVTRMPAAPAVNADPGPVSVPEPRRDRPTPTLLATGDEGGPRTFDRVLSNPVKAGHRPAGRPPVHEVNRLSAGLSAALDSIGHE